MKVTRIRYTVAAFLVVAILFAGTTYADAATGRQLAQSALSSLQSTAATSVTRNVVMPRWSFFEVNYYDETYPLTVDLIGSNFQTARKIIYLLPGGGVNFRSSFFTPVDRNLAQFFRDDGYLVIGITPREDNVPLGGSYSCMAQWGMEKHRKDIRKIISIIEARLHLPYRILGHSFGAAYALDYASSYPEDLLLDKVIALDIYSFNESYEADISYNAFLQLIASGQYADSSYSDMRSLMFISMLFPNIDSGEPRVDYPGDFTFEGLLYYSLINSYLLPGIHTPITGLAGDWPLIQGYAAGQYSFAQVPSNDTYSLDHSDMCLLREAAFKVGSGLVPCALYRDFFDVNGFCDTYTIDWSRIVTKVLWVNTGLGYGGNHYGSTLIKNVDFRLVAGYGHLDVLAGKTAPEDVWVLFK